MLRMPTVLAGVTLISAIASPMAGAQSGERLRKDLTSVIALQGKPCGKVIDAKKQGTNDYLATCSDGNRYHVFVGKSGRVIIEAL